MFYFETIFTFPLIITFDACFRPTTLQPVEKNKKSNSGLAGIVKIEFHVCCLLEQIYQKDQAGGFYEI